MAGLYTKVTPTMFEIDRVTSGKEMASKDFATRADFFLKCQFGIIVLFWTSVWAVKFSFLAFYRGLFNKLPQQLRYWRVVLLLVTVFYMGDWATQLASCEPPSHYFVIGKV